MTIAAWLVHVLQYFCSDSLLSLPIASFLISVSASEIPVLDTFDSYRGMINTQMDSDTLCVF